MTDRSGPYKSERAWAWRNMMVAGINAAVSGGLLSLVPGGRVLGVGFAFQFPGPLDAIGYISDAGWDEVSIHVALNPTEEGERFVRSGNAGFLAGDAFARGWLERREGVYLQTTPKMLKCRSQLLSIIAAAEVEPVGFLDRGKFRL